jgi:hypothetical protein
MHKLEDWAVRPVAVMVRANGTARRAPYELKAAVDWCGRSLRCGAGADFLKR